MLCSAPFKNLMSYDEIVMLDISDVLNASKVEYEILKVCSSDQSLLLEQAIDLALDKLDTGRHDGNYILNTVVYNPIMLSASIYTDSLTGTLNSYGEAVNQAFNKSVLGFYFLILEIVFHTDLKLIPANFNLQRLRIQNNSLVLGQYNEPF